VRRGRILLVGAFPSESVSQIKGGVRRACALLEKSQYFQEFDYDVVDSTQKSYPAPGVATRALSALMRLFRVFSIVRNWKPDMVLIFCTNGLSFYEKSLMGIIVRSAGSKSVLFPRGSARFSLYPRLNDLSGILLRHANLVICQGEIVRDFIQLTYQVPESRLLVIENWTATDILLQIGRDRQYSLEGVRRVLFVGWLEQAKGTDNLADVAQFLSKSSYNCEVHIVGDGSRKGDLAEKLRDCLLEGHVIFHSWINEEELRRLYSRCHIFFPAFLDRRFAKFLNRGYECRVGAGDHARWKYPISYRIGS
jgi:glycosyltransferase involved in cell wall biosynthesis